MVKIGETLRNARLAQNITIDDVVKETRIRSRYIEALEEENWGIFPGVVYLRGFLKAYCSLLGIDEQVMLLSLSEVIKPEPEAAPVPQRIELPGRPHRKLGLIFGVIAVILLMAFQYVYQNYINLPIPVITDKPAVQSPPSQPITENPQNPNPTSPDTNTSVTPVQEGKITSITLRLVGAEGKCWVRVRDGQKLIYEGTLTNGEEKVFADLAGVDMVFGNAGVVQYYLNDKDYGRPGVVDQVVTKKYLLENNEIKEVTIYNNSYNNTQ